MYLKILKKVTKDTLVPFLQLFQIPYEHIEVLFTKIILRQRLTYVLINDKT